MNIFLDTEFVQTADGPKFVSAAFVTDRGHQLYSELEPSAALALLARHPNQFVRDRVLPQLGIIKGAPWSELPARFSAWLEDLGAREADVIYDFNVDYELVERLLDSLPSPPPVLLHATHVGYLADDVDGKIAAATCWAAVETAKCVGRHHALADALALRARFEAVHCADCGSGSESAEPSDAFEVKAVVKAVDHRFGLVHAEASGGLAVCISEGTTGLSWSELRVGKTLACKCIRDGGTRVLQATVLAGPGETASEAQPAS